MTIMVSNSFQCRLLRVSILWNLVIIVRIAGFLAIIRSLGRAVRGRYRALTIQHFDCRE